MGARLDAGAGLTAIVGDDGAVRVGFAGADDWLGPATCSVGFEPAAPAAGVDDLGSFSSVVVADGPTRCSVRAYADGALVVFRAEATVDQSGLATGRFCDPSVAWPDLAPAQRDDGGVPAGAVAFGYQGCEFGLPTHSGPEMAKWFLLPHRPPSVLPLLVTAPGGATVLLAPLDSFHEHVAGVGAGRVRCGWHGDLESVPAGFATDLGVFAGDGPRACLEAWGRLLLERAGTVRPGRYADAMGRRPSYWTDNGAAYWYKTEAGHDVAETLQLAVDDLRHREVPFEAVQLDSWWYPHEVLRPFDTEEWSVPPTGLVAWEARDDVLPDGIVDLRRRLGDPPMAAHIRHLSAAGAAAAGIEAWVDGDRAHPTTSAPYERWLDQCVAWGVETFEHDWLVECFFGVRGLRSVPGRARAWQEGIDRAARDRGITLQWCMATPADFCQTTTLTQVTSIRTSGDHGYIATPGDLWAWFLYTNALARALGLHPFKDVFSADTADPGAHAEVEALLSVLSTGPVGIGDRIGRADPAVVRRTCRADGILVRPDVPIAAVDRSFAGHVVVRANLLVAECWTDHPAGRWAYGLTLNARRDGHRMDGSVALADLGEAAPAGDVVVWDWRRRRATPVADGGGWDVDLDGSDWDLQVVCPILAGGVAVVGDVELFAPAGDQRIQVAEVGGAVAVTVLGAGEDVTVVGWAAGAVSADVPVTRDGDLWSVTIPIGDRGWSTFTIRG